MSFIRKLVGWLFTYPAYRKLTEDQSKGVVATLALALYADGPPKESECEELSRELTGVPHYWAEEDAIDGIVGGYVARLDAEGFEAVARDIAPHLEGVAAEFLLVGAAFICNADGELTPLERENLTLLGRILGVSEDHIARIVIDPEGESAAMFAKR